jgi:hypothetical protein
MFPFSALVKKINEKHLIYNYEYDFSEMYYWLPIFEHRRDISTTAKL